MRRLALALLGALLLASPARAQPSEADAQVAEGQRLAKLGRFADSIARFKSADAAQPRAVHACYIALSYLRLGLPAQADLFVRRCASRATDVDPSPPWLGTTEKEVAAAIAKADVAPVELRVTPPEAAAVARVSIPAFPADELAAPGVIHLPFGEHTLSIEAPGFAAVSRTVTVRDRAPQEVAVELSPVTASEPAPSAVPSPEAAAQTAEPIAAAPAVSLSAQPPQEERPRSILVPAVLAGAGAFALGVGVVFHVKALDTKDMGDFDALEEDYGRERALTYTFYTVGVVALGVGAYLWWQAR